MKQIALILPALASSWALTLSPMNCQDTGESQMAPVRSATDFDAEAERMALCSEDLGKRRQTYAKLLDWSLQRSDVAQAIEAWSQSDDSKLAWTSELLLRERKLRAGTRGQLPRWFGGLEPSPFSRQQQLLFDLRDIFQGSENGWAHHPRFDDSWMNQLNGSQELQAGQSHSSAEAFKLESGPDGVKVEWKEQIDGKETTKTFEADSMQDLLETHPELKDKLSMGSMLERNPWSALGQGFLPSDRSLWRSLAPLGLGHPERTDILGVQVTTRDQGSVSIHGVDDGHGLTILGVVPGTIAQRLELEVGQTILYINDTQIDSIEDVQRALRMRSGHDELRVEVCNNSGKRKTLHWDPSPKKLRVY